MKKFILASMLCAATAVIAEEAPARKIGVANFAQCLSESKFGKKEQESLETLKNQMQSLVQDTEKSLKDNIAKLQDPDHLDGLSPDAENELKMKTQMLSEELGKYQNQFYQVLNQAQMKMVQTMTSRISEASKKVAGSHDFSFIINKDACYFYDEDVTALILEELDKTFDVENPAKD